MDIEELNEFDEIRKRAEAKTGMYRRVLGTPEGRIVFADMLNDLNHIAMDASSEGDVALQNYGQQLLAKLGVMQPHNIYRLVDAYLNMPYTEEKK